MPQGAFWACWHTTLCQINAMGEGLPPLSSENLLQQFFLVREKSTPAQDLWARDFLMLATDICQKEAQNFLTEEQADTLKIQWQTLQAQLPEIVSLRLSMTLATVFLSWCQDVNFFEKSYEECLEVFDENPLIFLNQEPSLWKNIPGS
jgi:hypothetical protein